MLLLLRIFSPPIMLLHYQELLLPPNDPNQCVYCRCTALGLGSHPMNIHCFILGYQMVRKLAAHGCRYVEIIQISCTCNSCGHNQLGSYERGFRCRDSDKTPTDNNITIPYYGYGQYRSVFNKSGIYTIAAIFMVQSTHNQN